MEISSIFVVTDIRSGRREEVDVEGSGHIAVSFLRKEYPRLTKIVLKGFRVDGDFKPLKLA